MEITASDVQRAYVMNGGSVVAQLNPNGSFYWLHLDHLGSGRKMTDTSGTMVYRAEFDPYGKLLYEWSAPSNLNTRKFTGYERDAATNLDYAQARMYASDWGRFISVDKLGLTGARLTSPKSLNRYSYASGDPINRVDRNGMEDGWWVVGDFTVNITASLGGAVSPHEMYRDLGLGGHFMIEDPFEDAPSGGGAQWAFQYEFLKFLTTMSGPCKNVLRDFIPALNAAALSTSFYDLSEVGKEKAGDYLYFEELEKYGLSNESTLDQYFQKKYSGTPIQAVAFPYEKKPGVYFRGGTNEVFSGDSMYFLLHEIFHMVHKDPTRNLDEMAVELFKIRLEGRDPSTAVSDFFNTGCRQLGADPPPPSEYK